MKSPEDDTGNGSVLSIKTVDSKGQAPKRRCSTPSAMWDGYQKARNMNVRRDARFGDIQGIFNGFPPTPPATQERNGMADLPNINTKQFQAKVMTYAGTWVALAAQGDGYAEVKARHEDSMEAERRSKLLTKHFNRAIRLWDNDDWEQGNQYILRSAARDTQMGLFGIGVAFFRDDKDFRWHIIPTRNVLVPDRTRLDLSNCPALWVIDEISVSDLYGMRGKDGWNDKAIERALYEHVELLTGTQNTGSNYSEWVNRIRNNDTWLFSEYNPVRMIHQFTMEFDGTISHSILTDLWANASSVERMSKLKEEDGNSFIYDKVKVAKRWQQVIVPFADNAGPECDWHGVKGFGDLIFDGCHLNNLMFNRAAIGAVLTNMLMFKGMNENDAQKLDQITLTNLGIMPVGLEMEQQRFQADIEGAMFMFNAGTQTISENTRISPQNEKTVTSEQPTATQVTADRADRAQLTSLQVMIYRSVGADVLFSEMYRRLSAPKSDYPESWGGGNVAKYFRECCERDGIPASELREIEYVRANRNGGSGDMMLDLMKAKELLAVATPGKGQLNARREVVSAVKGVEMVDAFIEEAPMPTPQDAEIGLENNLLQLGQAPEVFGWQDPVAHVTKHLELMAQGAEVIPALTEQGIGPQNLEAAKKLNNFIAAGVAHVQGHLQMAASIPRTGKEPALYEQFVKETTKQITNLDRMNQAFGEEIAKADQAQQPQMSPEMMKAQNDIAIDNAKAEADIARKDAAAKAKLGNMAIQAQARTEAKAQQQQLDSHVKAADAAQAREQRSLEQMQQLIQNKTEFDQQIEQTAIEGELKIAQEKEKAKEKNDKAGTEK